MPKTAIVKTAEIVSHCTSSRAPTSLLFKAVKAVTQRMLIAVVTYTQRGKGLMMKARQQTAAAALIHFKRRRRVFRKSPAQRRRIAKRIIVFMVSVFFEV